MMLTFKFKMRIPVDILAYFGFLFKCIMFENNAYKKPFKTTFTQGAIFGMFHVLIFLPFSGESHSYKSKSKILF